MDTDDRTIGILAGLTVGFPELSQKPKIVDKRNGVESWVVIMSFVVPVTITEGRCMMRKAT